MQITNLFPVRRVARAMSLLSGPIALLWSSFEGFSAWDKGWHRSLRMVVPWLRLSIP